VSELPRGWVRRRVDEVGKVQLGRQRSPEVHRGPNMRPYLRVANVFEDRINLDDVMEMHFSPDEVTRFELHTGDILLNEGQSRELVGRPAMYRGELPGACFTNSLVRFQAGTHLLPSFALSLFRHWMRRGDFQRIAQITTNIAHLGAGRFAAMEVPLPPLGEQRRIVAKLEALQERSRRARDALDAIPPLLEKLRQSILAAAFRGDLTKEWRAQHPHVEPADKLLARIRLERRKKWEETELAKMVAKGKPPKDDAWKKKYVEPKPVDTEGLPRLPKGWCWAAARDVVQPGTVITYGIVLPGPPLKGCGLRSDHAASTRAV
jgi:type I restriction enzyme S subunit